jgi:hypothetical protein
VSGDESTLIRDLASTRGMGFGMTDSPAEVEAETVAALRSAVAIPVAKAPDEVDAYRELVLGTATAVAQGKERSERCGDRQDRDNPRGCRRPVTSARPGLA